MTTNNVSVSDSITYATSSPYITTNAFAINNVSMNIEDVIEEKIKALEKNTRFTFTELSCRNCGGKINQKIDDYIVKCPYCGTAYLIGREQIYSR